MDFESWQQRLIIEKEDLERRIKSLRQYRASLTKLQPSDAGITDQLAHMNNYLQVLKLRIRLFLPDWRQQTIKERDELEKKLKLLKLFIDGDSYKMLDARTRLLLNDQWHHMSRYFEALENRILLFPKDTPP